MAQFDTFLLKSIYTFYIFYKIHNNFCLHLTKLSTKMETMQPQNPIQQQKMIDQSIVMTNSSLKSSSKYIYTTIDYITFKIPNQKNKDQLIKNIYSRQYIQRLYKEKKNASAINMYDQTPQALQQQPPQQVNVQRNGNRERAVNGMQFQYDQIRVFNGNFPEQQLQNQLTLQMIQPYNIKFIIKSNQKYFYNQKSEIKNLNSNGYVSYQIYKLLYIDFPNLQVLDLTSLRFLTIEPLACLNAPNIKKISVQNNRISNFKSSNKWYFKNLKILTVNNNCHLIQLYGTRGFLPNLKNYNYKKSYNFKLKQQFPTVSQENQSQALKYKYLYSNIFKCQNAENNIQIKFSPGVYLQDLSPLLLKLNDMNCKIILPPNRPVMNQLDQRRQAIMDQIRLARQNRQRRVGRRRRQIREQQGGRRQGQRNRERRRRRHDREVIQNHNQQINRHNISQLIPSEEQFYQQVLPINQPLQLIEQQHLNIPPMLFSEPDLQNNQKMDKQQQQ